jgi:hypothetical protein
MLKIMTGARHGNETLAPNVAEALERLATSQRFIEGAFPSGQSFVFHMDKPAQPVEIIAEYTVESDDE